MRTSNLFQRVYILGNLVVKAQFRLVGHRRVLNSLNSVLYKVKNVSHWGLADCYFLPLLAALVGCHYLLQVLNRDIVEFDDLESLVGHFSWVTRDMAGWGERLVYMCLSMQTVDVAELRQLFFVFWIRCLLYSLSICLSDKLLGFLS
jgi:hypothetical protein